MKKLTLASVLTAMAITTKSAFALDAAQAARVDELFKNYDHPNAPGAALMIIHNGKPVYAKGYGLADLVTKTPCTTNTNFRLASVSKQFTALAVLMLADRGKLKLDEKLTDFFPGFPSYGKQISVEQLLAHTAGLVEYDEIIPAGTTIPVLDQDVLRLVIEHTGDGPRADLHTVAWSENETDNAAKLKAELQQRAAAALTNRPTTQFPPGTKFSYSNSGYALLAMIVEARSGQTFARFLKQNIFEPLKMTNTLAYEQGLSVVPNRAFGHSQASNLWVRTDQSLTSSVLGDGGVYSSLADLLKWDQALYKSKIASDRVLRAAFAPHVKSDRAGLSYGYGWFVGEYRGLKEIAHNGSTIGFRNRIARYPEKRFTVIILSNRSGPGWDDTTHRIVDCVLFGGK